MLNQYSVKRFEVEPAASPGIAQVPDSRIPPTHIHLPVEYLKYGSVLATDEVVVFQLALRIKIIIVQVPKCGRDEVFDCVGRSYSTGARTFKPGNARRATT